MRRPAHPGDILDLEYLQELEMSRASLAEHLGVAVEVIDSLIEGHGSVSSALALRLGAALSTSPEFWLDLQAAHDRWECGRVLEHLPAPLIRDPSLSSEDHD